MPLTISVVVPTYNSEAVIGKCLESINAQSCRAVSVVVCDAGSADRTTAIATSLGATVISSVANRSAQRNAGAKIAEGDYVLFVDSDMRLTPKVLEECVQSFGPTDAALVVPEFDIGTSFWAKVRGFERKFYQDAWWLKAARCYRKTEFLQVGGFEIGMVGPEDWDLDERIRIFGNVREVRATIEHDEGQVSFGRLMEKKTHYAKSLEIFRDRHPKRAELCLSGFRRISMILKQPGRLVMHPVLATGLVMLGTNEILVARGRLNRWVRSSTEKPLDSKGGPLFGGGPR